MLLNPAPPARFALLALLLSGCAGGGDGAPTDTSEGTVVGDVLALEVRPATAQVYTGPDGGSPTSFEAWATFSDGSIARLENAEWSVSNSTAGAVNDGGQFLPAAGNGGVTYVTAEFDNREASALVTVTYQEVITTKGVDASLFTGSEVSHPGMWTYPQNGVNIPRNTPSIEFQWGDYGQSMVRLHFRSTVTDMYVYTTGTAWTADVDTWQQIAGTNAGGSVLVELSLMVGAEVWTDSPILLNVNRMDGEGTIYYWSTSAAGVMKAPYGGSASEFLTPATTGTSCVGCHAVANGRVAFTYDGGNGPLGAKNLADGSDIMAYGSGYIGNFKTYSPDGQYLLAAANGAALLFDAATMTYLGEVATGSLFTHPDWSPDNTMITFVEPAVLAADWSFSGGRIMVMDYLGKGRFGTPRVVYDPPDPYNAYYPTWSPDSQWIAFDVSTEDSYDDATAELYVVNGNGGDPIHLTQANVTGGITNSMPRWGPLPDDDVLWLAFSSKRSYGNHTAGWPQIWVAGFDPSRASRGEDPTWPAFWLPGQDVNQSNHIPFWSN